MAVAQDDVTTTGAGSGPPARWARAVVAGLGAVVVALVIGVLLAAALRWLDLGPTPFWRTGSWLAGLGLLGVWRQSVDAVTLDPTSWTTVAAGAPLLVTAAVVGWTWRCGRRDGLPPAHRAAVEALVAGGTASAAAYGLALLSTHRVEVANDAGTVSTVEGLAAWGAGGRLGVVPAAALLVGLVWLGAALAPRDPWRDAWRDAVAVLVVPGLLLSMLAAVGMWWLLSGWAIPVGVVLLLPLLGTGVLLAAAGAPVVVAVPRLTDGEVDVSTWSQGPAVVVAGLLAAVVVAALAGAWRARHRDPSRPLRSAVVTAVVGCALLAFAVSVTTTISAAFPVGLGGVGAFGVAPLPATLAGALLGAVSVLLGTPLARLRRRRSRSPEDRPVQ